MKSTESESREEQRYDTGKQRTGEGKRREGKERLLDRERGEIVKE